MKIKENQRADEPSAFRLLLNHFFKLNPALMHGVLLFRCLRLLKTIIPLETKPKRALRLCLKNFRLTSHQGDSESFLEIHCLQHRDTLKQRKAARKNFLLKRLFDFIAETFSHDANAKNELMGKTVFVSEARLFEIAKF